MLAVKSTRTNRWAYRVMAVCLTLALLASSFILSPEKAAAAYDPLDNWSLRSSFPDEFTDWYGIRFANGKFVAVGDHVIGTSINGADWDIDPTSYKLYDAAYAENTWIAVGDYCMAVSTDNAATWTFSNPGYGRLRGIDYGLGMWVAGGDNIVTSEDSGLTWSYIDIYADVEVGFVDDVCFNPGSIQSIARDSSTPNGPYIVPRFFAVGNNKEVYTVKYNAGYFPMAGQSLPSGDWEEIWDSHQGAGYLPYGSYLYGAAHGIMNMEIDGSGTADSIDADVWVGVGELFDDPQASPPTRSMGGALYTSIRGNSAWHEYLSDSDYPEPIAAMRGVCYSPNLGAFVAVGDGASAVAASGEGYNMTWEVHKQGVLFSDMNEVAYGNGYFVAVGVQGTVNRSSNGIDWDRITGPDPTVISNWKAVVRGRNEFLSGGHSANTSTVANSSADGHDWSSIIVGGKAINGAAWGSSQYIAVGKEGLILQSSNGDVWNTLVSGVSSDLTAVAYGGGSFLAVGNNGSVVSVTGSTCTVQPWAGGPDLISIAYGQDREGHNIFVALDTAGTFYSSSNGNSWQNIANTAQALNSMAFGNGHFVAVGSGCALLLVVYDESNGDWLLNNDPNLADFKGVAFGGGVFAAVGMGGEIFTSKEGVSWIERPSFQAYDDLRAVTYGVKTFVAVGDQGLIVQSGPHTGSAFTHATTDLEDIAVSMFDLAYDLILGSNIDSSTIISDLTLPTSGTRGTSIEWISSAPDFIANTGVVTRPAAGQANRSVTLEARISKPASTYSSKYFNLTVVALNGFNDSQAIALDKIALTFDSIKDANTAPDNILTNLSLPDAGENGTTITWNNSPAGFIGTNGTVTRPGFLIGDQAVTLTATISRGGFSDIKQFSLTVKKLDPTDSEAVLTEKNLLSFDDFKGSNSSADYIFTDLVFPTAGEYGTYLAWASSNTSAIDNDGTVTRPAIGAADITVQITATISKGTASDTKAFNLVVKPNTYATDQEWLTFDVIKGENTAEDNITSDLYLPAGGEIEITFIYWDAYDYVDGVLDTSASSDFIIVSGTPGTVNRPTTAQGDQQVELVAALETYDQFDLSAPPTYSYKDFTLTVKALPAELPGETDITAFSLAEQTGPATINATNHTVDITVAYGTNPDSLVAIFALSKGATARVNGTVQYSGVTANDFNSPVTYAVTAANGTIQDWLVTVHVESTPPPVNHPPVADDQVISTAANTTKAITLTGSDDDGDTITFNAPGDPPHGALTGSGANWTYTPDTDYTGPDSFTFTVNDGKVNSAPATVQITVNPAAPVNHAPSFTKGADQTAYSSDPKTITGWAADISSGPAGESGQAVHFLVTNDNNALFSVQPAISPDGTLTFTPGFHNNGAAAVTVTLQDDGGTANGGDDSSNSQTFTITVDLLLPASNLSASDPDNTNIGVDGRDFHISWTTSVTQGILRQEIYLLPEGTSINTGAQAEAAGFDDNTTASWTGGAALTTDSAGNPLTAGNYRIYVVSYRSPSTPPYAIQTSTAMTAVEESVVPVNHKPTVENINATVEVNKPVFILLTGQDEDAGDILSIGIVTPPTHGSYDLSTSYYTPATDYVGTDSFTYKANDGKEDSNPGTVILTMGHSPVANPQSVTTEFNTPVDIILTASDPDEGDTLTFYIGDQPVHGTLILSGAICTYTPATGYSGSDSFTFAATDGLISSPGAKVSITVNPEAPVNEAPVAYDGAALVQRNGSASITLEANDPDGDSLTCTIVDSPANGVLTGSGTTRTYRPNAGFTGLDSCTFTANDGTEDSNTATISLVVTSRETYAMNFGSSGTLNIGPGQSITLYSSPADGETTFSSGTWYVFLNSDFSDDSLFGVDIGSAGMITGEARTAPDHLPLAVRSLDIVQTFSLVLSVDKGSITVPAGGSLSVTITNKDQAAHQVMVGEDTLAVPPEEQPKPPVPELPAVMLLGLGLTGLATWMVFNRRKADTAIRS